MSKTAPLRTPAYSNRAWRDALAAVATGTVLLGDKAEADKYKQYNVGHVADLVQPCAGTVWC